MTARSTFLLLLVIAILFSYFLVTHTDVGKQGIVETTVKPGERYYSIPTENIKFNLLDPEMAPETRLAYVLYGYHIVMSTQVNAPDYVGGHLDCKNCHFNGGNSLGEKNRGISLVGVTAKYPHFAKRVNKVLSLADRVNMCFERSLNGRPLPIDSLEMESILAYLSWISLEVQDATIIPWLGLPKIKSKHEPNAGNGRKIYARYCALCHGHKGEGSNGVPPVWGPYSYNAGAGLNIISMLAPFVLLNMPYGQPTLTEEQALDVAAYIIAQPRPKAPQEGKAY